MSADERIKAARQHWLTAVRLAHDAEEEYLVNALSEDILFRFLLQNVEILERVEVDPALVRIDDAAPLEI